MRSILCTGYTLIEILTAVTIAAVVAALLFPSVQTMLANSRRAACVANLRGLGAAFHLYQAENNGSFPPLSINPSPNGKGDQWDLRILEYLTFPTRPDGNRMTTGDTKTVFFCPASKPFPNEPLVRGLSYAYNRHVAKDEGGSGRLQTIDHPSRLLLLIDREWSLGTNESYILGQGQNNGPPFVSNTTADWIPYKARHQGLANILFADGHVDSRRPVGSDHASGVATNFPRGILWRNDGTLTLE